MFKSFIRGSWDKAGKAVETLLIPFTWAFGKVLTGVAWVWGHLMDIPYAGWVFAVIGALALAAIIVTLAAIGFVLNIAFIPVGLVWEAGSRLTKKNEKAENTDEVIEATIEPALA